MRLVTPPQRIAVFALGAVVFGLAGCDGVLWQSCTLIGCVDGVTVVVTGAASPSLRLEAVADDGYTLTHTCDVVAGECVIEFARFTPDGFMLTISGTDDYLALELTPSYEVVQPNGPDCAPACRVATVRIALAPPGATR